ncbi:MAG: T9SS type A sorting domain-containing protein, partial [Bacteroidota bacterium]
LREITAIPMLSSIGQNLELKSNPSLIHLDGFTQLANIGQNLSIRFNYALKRIGGLANLEHIGGSLTLSNSDSLEDACLLNDISQAVSTFPDNVSISIPNKLLENCETDIKIQRIYLFRADNGALVQELNEGDQIDLNQFNDIPLNIRVEVNEVFLGRVGLQLEGALAQSNASLEPPFELFGQGKPFPEGIYTLQVWVQGGNDGRGPILDYRRLNFQIGAAPTLNVGKIQLIDVLSNLPGTELKEGDTVFINPQDLRKLSIEALPSPEVIGSMRFELQGPLSHTQVENIAPYGLFGNDQGNRNKFLGEIFPEGSYQLKVFAYPSSQAQGSAADSLSLNFEVRYESPNQPSLERLEVIGFRPDNRNSDISNQDLPPRLLQDGDTLTFKRQSPPRFSIRAISHPLEVGSVHFKLRGRRAFEQTENLFPYVLFGNYGQEQFFYDKEFPEGNYTLEVTPYSEKNRQGQAGETLIVHFWVRGIYADIRINHFELHSRATGQKVIGIGNRDTLRKEKLGPGAFDVHAITVPENIGSVVYQVKRPNDLRFSSEFFARNNPYIVLRGTDLSPGQYQIRATPFTEAQGQGDFGRTLGLTFEVIEDLGILIYPNPNPGQFQINPNQDGQLEIYDPQGALIWQGYVEKHQPRHLDIPSERPGTYILRLNSGSRMSETRVLIQ